MTRLLDRVHAQVVSATIAAVAVCISCDAAADTHGADFWRSLKAAEFKLSPEIPVFPLTLEATDHLGSTDPELRDGIAYEAFYAWVYRDERLTPAELNRLRAVLERNAKRGLGKSEDDSLFLRSFSILVLSVLAAEDLKKPFLDAQSFESLVDLGIEELGHERDLRGYVPAKGWGHATAHSADLLKFLARNPQLKREDQIRIVTAVAGRLQSAGQVFVWGEDARLAAALTSLAHRGDADPAPFVAWFTDLRKEHTLVWGGNFEVALYTKERAQLNALSELAANLEADGTPGATQDIRAALRTLRLDLR